MLIEQFKPIKNYEGLYEVSNFGQVKSLKRVVKNSGSYNGSIPIKGKIKKNSLNFSGYYAVCLSKNGKSNVRTVHTLVWDAFGDKSRDGLRLQVDHKDENKLNNRIDNLQLLTNRENTTKMHSLDNKRASKFIGVSIRNKDKRWVANIVISGKKKFLGSFDTEEDASIAYQNKLKEISGSPTVSTLTTSY